MWFTSPLSRWTLNLLEIFPLAPPPAIYVLNKLERLIAVEAADVQRLLN